MRTRAAVAWQAHAPLTIETVDLHGRKSGQGLAIALAPQRWALGHHHRQFQRLRAALHRQRRSALRWQRRHRGQQFA